MPGSVIILDLIIYDGRLHTSAYCVWTNKGHILYYTIKFELYRGIHDYSYKKDDM